MNEYQTFELDVAKYIEDAGWGWTEIVHTAREGLEVKDQHDLEEAILTAWPGIGDDVFWDVMYEASKDLVTFCANLVQNNR